MTAMRSTDFVHAVSPLCLVAHVLAEDKKRRKRYAAGGAVAGSLRQSIEDAGDENATFAERRANRDRLDRTPPWTGDNNERSDRHLPPDLAQRRQRFDPAPSLTMRGQLEEDVPHLAHGGALLPQDEEAFQSWYAQMARDNHLDPNVDAPEHHYDMRGAYQSGSRGALSADDNRLHFPSRFKTDDHPNRSEEHTSELQSPDHLVCRLLLEKKKKNHNISHKPIGH